VCFRQSIQKQRIQTAQPRHVDSADVKYPWHRHAVTQFCVQLLKYSYKRPERVSLCVLTSTPQSSSVCTLLLLTLNQFFFNVEYIYGFVWWGVCKQSRWRHRVTEPSEDSGYVLLWQRYDNNKMVAMRYYGNVILHLQHYSHRLNLLFFFKKNKRNP